MGRYDQFDQPNRINRFRVLLMILLIASVVGIGYFFYPTDSSSGPENQNQSDSTRREIPLKIPIKESPAKPAAETKQSNINAPPTEKVASQTPLAPPPPPIRTVLPTLNQSDLAIQEDIKNLSPALNHWFNSSHLIRKYLNIINDFSQGQRPGKHFRFLRLTQAFIVKSDAKGLIMAPESYRRYDSLVNAIDQLDINISLKYYQVYQPLLQQIFDEFGYPETHELDDLFKKAIAQILGAPILNQPIALVRHVTRYKFADAELEALNPVHKQIIRMGPKNTKILQNKLRKFVQALTKVENEIS